MFTQPLGTLGHFHVTYRQTAVPRTRLTILDSYRNGFSRRIVDLKIIDRRTSQSIGITVLFEPCGQIAGYPVMRCRIDAIGGNIDLQYIIAFEVVIFLRRSPGYGTLGQYDDTVVRCTDSDFILGTYHTVAFDSAYFRFLDCKAFFARIKDSSDCRYHDMLTGSDIGCAANDLRGNSVSQIHGRNMQMIGIGVSLTCKDFSYNQPFEATFHGLHFLYSSGFKAYGSQSRGDFFGCQRQVEIIFQPIIRDIHNL